MNQNVEEMRECSKTKREIGARTEGFVAKIEGVGDVRCEELGEWESMTKRRSSPLPPKKRECKKIHPQQHSLFLERLGLPYPDEEISSGYEEDVSFIRDGFATWVKADFNTMERHEVHTGKALADFREPSVRRHDISSQEYHSSTTACPTAPLYRKDSASTTGTQDLDVEGKGAIEKLIAVKLHIITLQGAIKYVDHEFLTNRFHVNHYEGRAVRFNKDTSFPDVKVTSMYFHKNRNDLQDTVREGDSGWVIQCVLSRALFSATTTQRPKITHSDISPHQQ